MVGGVKLQVKNVRIKGMGYFVPKKILTNYELEHMVETTNEWIIERSGIHERRILDKDKMNVEMAIESAHAALEDANINPDELDLIIVATITPDYFTPSAACMVQAAIGADKAAAFDLNAACSGFVYGLATGAQFIASGIYKNVLIIGCEGLSKVLDWGHRSTCVLFGDGAGAAVLTESDSPSLLEFDLGALGTSGMAITIPGTHFSEKDIESRNNERVHTLRMDGREVFKFATKTMSGSVAKLLKDNNLTTDDIKLIVPHQANIRIMQTAAKRLGITMDKIYSVIDKYGNTSSASIPIALCNAVAENRIKAGDKIVLTGFGGGLTWASVIIDWK